MMNGVVRIAFVFLISALPPTWVFAQCMACHQGEVVESDKTAKNSDDVNKPISKNVNE